MFWVGEGSLLTEEPPLDDVDDDEEEEEEKEVRGTRSKILNVESFGN